MFEDKMRDDKVELVKRIIRQNNYHQYEKTHNQCLDLGLNVNRSALDRFASKLELIDKAILAKRQHELAQLEQAEKREKAKQQKAQNPKALYQQEVYEQDFSSAELASQQSPPSPAPAPAKPQKKARPSPSPEIEELRTPQKQQSGTQNKKTALHKMTYEEVKQRETEITFALGELKIRENELLQELISLTEMLDSNQVN